MSRTHRNLNSRYFRRPQTLNEIRQITGILQDESEEDYFISGLNHLHHRLAHVPTSWDDIVKSSYFETKWN